MFLRRHSTNGVDLMHKKRGCLRTWDGLFTLLSTDVHGFI